MQFPQKSPEMLAWFLLQDVYNKYLLAKGAKPVTFDNLADSEDRCFVTDFSSSEKFTAKELVQKLNEQQQYFSNANDGKVESYAIELRPHQLRRKVIGDEVIYAPNNFIGTITKVIRPGLYDIGDEVFLNQERYFGDADTCAIFGPQKLHGVCVGKKLRFRPNAQIECLVRVREVIGKTFMVEILEVVKGQARLLGQIGPANPDQLESI